MTPALPTFTADDVRRWVDGVHTLTADQGVLVGVVRASVGRLLHLFVAGAAVGEGPITTKDYCAEYDRLVDVLITIPPCLERTAAISEMISLEPTMNVARAVVALRSVAMWATTAIGSPTPEPHVRHEQAVLSMIDAKRHKPKGKVEWTHHEPKWPKLEPGEVPVEVDAEGRVLGIGRDVMPTFGVFTSEPNPVTADRENRARMGRPSNAAMALPPEAPARKPNTLRLITAAGNDDGSNAAAEASAVMDALTDGDGPDLNRLMEAHSQFLAEADGSYDAPDPQKDPTGFARAHVSISEACAPGLHVYFDDGDGETVPVAVDFTERAEAETAAAQFVEILASYTTLALGLAGKPVEIEAPATPAPPDIYAVRDRGRDHRVVFVDESGEAIKEDLGICICDGTLEYYTAALRSEEKARVYLGEGLAQLLAGRYEILDERPDPFGAVLVRKIETAEGGLS